jgi:hypothetical protein
LVGVNIATQMLIESDDVVLHPRYAVQRSSPNGSGFSRFDPFERLFVRKGNRRPSRTSLQLRGFKSSRLAPEPIGL